MPEKERMTSPSHVVQWRWVSLLGFNYWYWDTPYSSPLLMVRRFPYVVVVCSVDLNVRVKNQVDLASPSAWQFFSSSVLRVVVVTGKKKVLRVSRVFGEREPEPCDDY